jgi:transposase-like protein
MRSKNYSKDFKESIIQKVLSPNSKGFKKTADELGLAVSTLYSWQKNCANHSNMKNKKSNSPKDWTPEKKFEAIIKTASMNEQAFGEYLRSHGLHSADLEQWKLDISNTLKADVGRPKKDPEVLELRKREQELESELKRKDRALAEVTARVVLLKKSHLLFGKDEDS